MGKGSKIYNSFIRGMITEAGPLTFPENASTEDVNCEITVQGRHRRRWGFDFQNATTGPTYTTTASLYNSQSVNTFTWRNVNNDATKTILCTQNGKYLKFFNISTAGSLVASQIGIGIDITGYAVSGFTSTVPDEPVSMTSGKGYLFVTGPHLKPFYVTMDSGLTTATAAGITILVRDFEGLSDGLAIDETPTTLSDAHKYNLRNQGWKVTSAGTDTITTFLQQGGANVYPANTMQYFVGRNSVTDLLQKTALLNFAWGNTPAPKGYYKLDYFNKDRATTSGISGLSVVSKDTRPNDIAFYAGRVWYIHENTLLYSQILTDITKAGLCYQEADPTAEDITDIIATDGGTITVAEMGVGAALFVTGNKLLCIAGNGCWEICGKASDEGFDATSFSVRKVSSNGILSRDTLIDINGSPAWWSEVGIVTYGPSEVSGIGQLKNISEGTIQTFYDKIPALSKGLATGVYDSIQKKAMWLYNSSSSQTSKYRFDRVLILDVRLGAFYEWRIGANSSWSISGVFNTPYTTTINPTVSGTQVNNTVYSDVMFMCLKHVTGNDTTGYINFGYFKEGTLVDWKTDTTTGVDYESFVTTGYEIAGDPAKHKQATYISVFSDRTETGVSSGNLINQGSLMLQSRWDWSDSGSSGKWSNKQEAYRWTSQMAPRTGDTTITNGLPVVVTRLKQRGRGRSLHLKFSSTSGKDFSLLGWKTTFTDDNDE